MESSILDDMEAFRRVFGMPWSVLLLKARLDGDRGPEYAADGYIISDVDREQIDRCCSVDKTGKRYKINMPDLSRLCDGQVKALLTLKGVVDVLLQMCQSYER